MKKSPSLSLRHLTVAAALAAGFTAPAQAQTTPVFAIDLPAGLACVNFTLGLELYGERSVYREFRDKNGNLVRTFAGGKGYTLKYYNRDSGASLTLKPNGSNDVTTYNPDGTWNFVTTGHYAIIYFPTDIAPGVPFARQFVGRTVQHIDPSTGVYTLKKVSGTSTDICAVLSN